MNRKEMVSGKRRSDQQRRERKRGKRREWVKEVNGEKKVGEGDEAGELEA